MNTLKIKSKIIGTPLSAPLVAGRYLTAYYKALRKPEQRDVLLEPFFIDKFLDMSLLPMYNCIDIGSHLGFTLEQFKQKANLGTHLAFEPDKYKADLIADRYKADHRVKVHNMALSDFQGSAFLNFSSQGEGYSSLAKGSDGEAVAVRVEMLDDMVSPMLRYNFIKIDVEGAELPVLKGAKKLLKRDSPTILFECCQIPKDFNYTHEHLYNFLTRDMDYSIYKVRDAIGRRNKVSLQEFQDSAVYPFKAFNWVAEKNNRWEPKK